MKTMTIVRRRRRRLYGDDHTKTNNQFERANKNAPRAGKPRHQAPLPDHRVGARRTFGGRATAAAPSRIASRVPLRPPRDDDPPPCPSSWRRAPLGGAGSAPGGRSRGGHDGVAIGPHDHPPPPSLGQFPLC
jgi:hypothetical protein